MTIMRYLMLISSTTFGVCFQRSTLEAITGLALTAANYREAVSILEKQFGNKPQIITKHMDVLIHVDAVNSCHNVKGLPHLYDVIESNVRSLISYGCGTIFL